MVKDCDRSTQANGSFVLWRQHPHEMFRYSIRTAEYHFHAQKSDKPDALASAVCSVKTLTRCHGIGFRRHTNRLSPGTRSLGGGHQNAEP